MTGQPEQRHPPSVHPPSVHPEDPFDPQRVLSARGLLAAFNAAGVIAAGDTHVASRVPGLVGERRETVALALALAVRAVRLGSVCVDLEQLPATVGTADGPPLPWPDPQQWLRDLTDSPLVAVGDDPDPAPPLRLAGGLLYLDTYWRQERLVAAELDARAAAAPPVDVERLAEAVHRLLPGPVQARQRVAAALAATRWLSVITGGPGTGKTTTVARLLAVLADQPGPWPPTDALGPRDPGTAARRGAPRIALAAPTGKAAARLGEAVTAALADLPEGDAERVGRPAAATLHRLLGPLPGVRNRFRYNASQRLPYDVVVVDETSMIPLTMMARLLEAVDPSARLVLVGDPDQLASVEAGAVLADIAARPVIAPGAGHDPRDDGAPDALQRSVGADLAQLSDDERDRVRAGVIRLRHRFRFDGAIADLAAAMQTGDGPGVLQVLRAGAAQPSGIGTVTFLELDPVDPSDARLAPLARDVIEVGRATALAAAAGDVSAALGHGLRHRLLCAHRSGPYGARRWGHLVHTWLASRLGGVIPGYGAGDWYLGRPLLVRENDYETGVFNGDTGVVVAGADGGVVAAIGNPQAAVMVAPSRLPAVDTVHAMTVHKSQGSQFETVTVILPEPGSLLLSRELLYTAVTRATTSVRLIGTAEAVLAAVARPVTRASGLRG